MNARYLIAFALCILPVVPVFADNVTYTIDPTRSSLTISGIYDSLPMLSQPAFGEVTPNFSFTTSYSGTITADRETMPDTVQISGGTVGAQDNGFWTPSSSPPLPANYGFEVTDEFDVPAGGVTVILGAIRGLSFSMSSSVINSPTTFDAALLSATISSGQTDYTVAGGSSFTSSSLPGNLSFDSAPASLTSVGGIETLTVPVETDLSIIIEGQPLDMHLSGTLVAAAPEPSSLVFLAMPVFLLCSRRK